VTLSIVAMRMGGIYRFRTFSRFFSFPLSDGAVLRAEGRRQDDLALPSCVCFPFLSFFPLFL
jgi:hypothetical protein